ncbi:MAG: 50S ribosomal protein L4 [Planctomycetes bacterium]|nr:50S ribosomal protein L4 [Planctomycetota bacterium]
MGLELKKTDLSGAAQGSVNLDEANFGGMVKNRLIHAANVMYHANMRQGSACTKTRAEIAGSTKKLYKQKGTGRARAGNRKSGTRKGGGVIHGPKPRDFSYSMPRKQRQAALRSALLGKAKDGELHAVTGLDFSEPKSKHMAALLSSLELGVETACVATDGLKRNVYLAGRNIPGVTVVPAAELNARHVAAHKHLVIDASALEALNAKPSAEKRGRKPKGTRKSGAVKGADAEPTQQKQGGE